ncbi:MAG: DUF445 domain-containing protein, partial [Acidimicrobiia bacterium]
FLAVTATSDGGGWVGYLEAALEAAMVGGLADWFAVTALFRRPLGLPIPHTAVVAERKDAFGHTLGEFVQANFLSAEVVTERVRTARVVPRAAAWLSGPGAESIARHLTEMAAGLAEVVGEEEMSDYVEKELRQALASVPLAPLAGRALRAAAANGRDRAFLDATLPALARFLEDNRGTLRNRFEVGSPWWLPERVERRIFGQLLDGAVSLLGEIRDDPHHDMRRRFSEFVWSLADRLETSPEMAARAETLKADILGDPALRHLASTIADQLRSALKGGGGEGSDAELSSRLARGLAAAGRRLQHDAELAAKAERLITSAAGLAASHFSDEITGLVSTTMARWDGAETSAKLELLLGRDLQFIRVNGTVVGGIAGVAIHAVAESLR